MTAEPKPGTGRSEEAEQRVAEAKETQRAGG